MSLSLQRATSDGTLSVLALSIDYFDRSEITVLFDGVKSEIGWNWVGSTDKVIQFIPDVPNGVEVTVLRTTDLSDPRHIFSLGAAFKAVNVDEDFKHILHAAQESRERVVVTDMYDDLDMHGNVIHSIAPAILPNDAVPLVQLQEKIIAADSGAVLNTLATSSGSSLIGFIQSGTGSIPRTLQDKALEVKSSADYTSLQAAISAAITSNSVVSISADITVRVPTDAATLQIAFDRLSPTNRQAKITVQIDSGHQPESGVTLANGDFGQWEISSVDATVTLAPGFVGRFVNCTNGVAPVLNTYIIGHAGVERIYSLFGATGKVMPTKGGQNTYGRILYGNAATIDASGSVWKNHGDSIYFSAGSSVQLGNALIDGATVTANGALVASRGSAVEAQGITIKNCEFAVECKRAGSSINMHGSTLDNISRIGIRASRGAAVSCEGLAITNLGPSIRGSGLEAYAATISAVENVTITYSSPPVSDGGYAVRASNGGLVACPEIVIVNARTAIYAAQGGRIDASGCVVNGATSYGVISRQGSHVNVIGGSVKTSGGNDLRVTEGAIISANGCSTTNGVGTPNVIDTNLNGFGGLNAFGASGRGIIFA